MHKLQELLRQLAQTFLKKEFLVVFVAIVLHKVDVFVKVQLILQGQLAILQPKD